MILESVLNTMGKLRLEIACHIKQGENRFPTCVHKQVDYAQVGYETVF